MDTDKDDQIEALFADALEIPDGERLEWLENACRGDRELLAEVRSLLKAYAIAPRLLDRSMIPGWDGIDPDGEPESLTGRTLGPWQIIRLIATGGMGAVYLGERIDDSFRKKVAIKILPAGSFHPGLVSQFRTERQVLADLDHPGIARLLDGGTTAEGMPYFVMEFVDGSPIRDAARDRNLSIEQRLRLFLEVADAVQYAHTNLVIHRDLKPGNIFVREDGHPKLLDFGIAKVVRPAGASDGAETVMGTSWALTPRYASPEQIRGERVTTATDIYSLGVVLYELLTERIPCVTGGHSIVDIGRAICDVPPVPPSRIRGISEPRRFAGDLDTILLKALAKEPGRRYASVADFADDIRRHLQGEPVMARGDSAGYRLGRFASRNRGLVAGVVAFIATLLAALAVTFSFYREARNSAATARWHVYTSTLAAVESAIMNHNMREAGELLGTLTTGLQSWEYRHLKARLDRSQARWKAHDAGITRLRFSPDGARLLSTGIDKAARVWRVDTRDSIAAWRLDVEVESGGFFPDGDRVALGLTDGRVMLATVGVSEPELLGRGRSYAIVEVNPAGTLIAGGFDDGAVALFDVASRREIRRWPAHPRLSVPLFSPDGTQLATAGSDSLVKIWDLGTGELRATLRGHRHRIYNLAYSRDGRKLVSGSRDRTATVWDLDTGLPVSSFSEHRGTVGALAFHPDGRSVLSAGSEGRVMVWDPATGAQVAEYHGQESDVSAVDVAPGGGLSATGEWNGLIRLWAWGTDDIRVLAPSGLAFIIPLLDIDIDPAGKRVASLGAYGEIVVRDISGKDLWTEKVSGATSIAMVDSTTLMIGNDRGRISRYDRLRFADSTVAFGGIVHSLCLDRRHSRLASAGDDGFVRLWQLPGLDPLRAWNGQQTAIEDVAFDPAGGVLASAGQDGTIRLWSADTADSLGVLFSGDGAVKNLAFHPSGRLLAFTKASGAACLWDLQAASPPDTLLHRGNGAFAVTFTPDGERVVVGSSDQIVYIFDVKRRAPTLRLHGHIGRVSGVRFTPDGGTLLSASSDGTIRVWDAPDAE